MRTMIVSALLFVAVGCGGEPLDAEKTSGMLILGDKWHCSGTMTTTTTEAGPDRREITGSWSCEGEAPHSDWTTVRLRGVVAGRHVPSDRTIQLQFASPGTSPFEVVGNLTDGVIFADGTTDDRGSVPAGPLHLETF